MRMLEEAGKISNNRNMEDLTHDEAPSLIPPPDEASPNPSGGGA